MPAPRPASRPASPAAPGLPPSHPARQTAVVRWIGPVGSIALLAALIAVLASVGHFEPADQADRLRIASIAAAAWTIVVGGALAAAYLLAALGLGRIAWPIIRSSPSRLWLQAAIGAGLMLWSSHLLGMLGLLSGPGGPYAAWGIVALGLLLLVHQIVRGELHPECWPVLPPWVLIAIPAAAVMLTAACSPPGWLWETEKRAFDVLSYHLQLPREWAEGRRLWPLQHNVYSFLPSYTESAYLHVAAMVRAGDSGGPALIGGAGAGAMACQMLHAGLGFITALLIARVVWMVVRRATDIEPSREVSAAPPAPAERSRQPSAARFPAIVAGAFALSIPWIIVVGSMAYNELAVTAAAAGALLAALDLDLNPWRRGALAGFLVGIAVSAKPTAMFVAAPWVGIALLGIAPRRAWIRACAAGAAAGATAVAPWVARNCLAAGNPVFPFGARWFSSAHWSPEQVQRYTHAHSVEHLADRFTFLLSDDRGILHPQWSIAFPIAAVAALIAIAWRPARREAALLSAGAAASLAGWMLFTHCQSRFLIPLVVPMAALVGLAVAALSTLASGGQQRDGRGLLWWTTRLACAAVPLGLAGKSALNFVAQQDGRPNYCLAGGVATMTGAALEDEYRSTARPDREFFLQTTLIPEWYDYFGIEPDQTVYLLGDSTPLYFRTRVLYHTTWDRSPLGDAIRDHPDDPAAWAAALASRGVDYILVNWSELHRLVDVDHWYDPAVTLPLVHQFVTRYASPVREWPPSGQALYRLEPGGARPAPARDSGAHP